MHRLRVTRMFDELPRSKLCNNSARDDRLTTVRRSRKYISLFSWWIALWSLYSTCQPWDP